jgi:hypothetical protein
MRSGSSLSSRTRFREDDAREDIVAVAADEEYAVEVRLLALGWKRSWRGCRSIIQRLFGERRPSKMLGGKSDCVGRTLFMADLLAPFMFACGNVK